MALGGIHLSLQVKSFVTRESQRLKQAPAVEALLKEALEESSAFVLYTLRWFSGSRPRAPKVEVPLCALGGLHYFVLLIYISWKCSHKERRVIVKMAHKKGDTRARVTRRGVNEDVELKWRHHGKGVCALRPAIYVLQ